MLEHRHEIVNFHNKLPIKFFLHRIGNVNRHWHQSIELLVNVNGTVIVTIEGEKFELVPGDMILINSNEIHELYSEDATMIALQLKLELLKELSIDTNSIYFNCNSVIDNQPNKFLRIKQIISQILKFNMDHDELVDYKNVSLVYDLIYELNAKFKIEKKESKQYSGFKLDRLNRILTYINSNYHEDISLKTMAEIEYLTVPYLSKFFTQNMGVTFSHYLKQIRLHHAVLDLLNEALTIEEIAIHNGFSNTRSFVTAFKEKFDELPSVWRKENIGKVLGSIEATKEKSVNYFQVESHTYYKEISKFINDHLNEPEVITPNMQVNNTPTAFIPVNANNNELELTHTFKNFIGVSRAKEILTRSVQEALTTVQEEIGFKFIKMHSLLDDDMMVYAETKEGKAIYNFDLIDQVFDFLLSINLKPLVQFSFMPSKLASDLNKTVFYNQINTSPPNDMNKWCELIKNLTIHLINRYGRAEVRSWLFSVWNEPSTSNHLFGFSENKIFYDLYERTFLSVKKIDPLISFGGPAAFSTYGKNEEWFFNFLKFSQENNCLPDFITIHYYDIDLTAIQKVNTNFSYHHLENKAEDNLLRLSPVKDSFSQFIDRVKRGLKEINLDDKKVFLTEWNSTTSHRDLMSDTCFKSAYIVKNITENYDKLDSFGYWLLTDQHEENRLSDMLFHGGLGLIAYHNIKKPSYHAFSFLNQLGNILVQQGDGYFITKKEDNYQILIHNYHHYNEIYASGLAFDLSYKNRYSNFSKISKRGFNFEFEQVDGLFEITHQIVNRKYGSAFDNQLKLGKFYSHSIDELDYLKNMSVPKMKIEQLSSNGNLNIEAELEPFEIRLIKVKKIYEN